MYYVYGCYSVFVSVWLRKFQEKTKKKKLNAEIHRFWKIKPDQEPNKPI